MLSKERGFRLFRRESRIERKQSRAGLAQHLVPYGQEVKKITGLRRITTAIGKSATLGFAKL
jgi:hypothetical protein